MVPGNDGDRPRKSWREIDNARGQSTHRRDDRLSAQGQGQQSSQAYRSYKTQLNRLFDGGIVPEALQSKLEDAGVGSAAKERKAALEALKAAATPRSLLQTLAAFRAAHGFPEDEEVLGRLIELEDETAIVLEAVQTLTRLHEEGRLKRAAALKMRLKTTQMTVDDPDVQEGVKSLLSRL